jgi:uncharacterized protein with HEPN domain
MKLIAFLQIDPKTLLNISLILGQKAVERNIEIIGEAVSRILKKDVGFQLSNSRKIVDNRNRIIHGYDSVSDEMIWSIVIRHLPVLKTEVEMLLNN